MSRLFNGRRGVVSKLCLLGDKRKQGSRGPARPVHPGLPLADSLLPRAQPLGELLLGQPQVSPQGLDALTVPLFFSAAAGLSFSDAVDLFFAGGGLFIHGLILKDIVSGVNRCFLPHPLTPSPKEHWFPTFVGMVKGGKGNQFERGNIERGIVTSLRRPVI